jgi:hypothetical protein
MVNKYLPHYCTDRLWRKTEIRYKPIYMRMVPHILAKGLSTTTNYEIIV